MAWPDFSELTFAFAFLRELDATLGPFAVPPNFISQAQEHAAGYDAEVALGGAILFVQFKRSEVMTRSTAKEVQAGHISSPPVFRMHLRKRHAYAQHTALQALEAQGHRVIYATSGAPTRAGLFAQSMSGRLLQQSGLFTAGEIALPDKVHPHHVSFRADLPQFWVYSEDGRVYDRRIIGSEGLRKLLADRQRTPRQNRQLLEKFVAEYSTPTTNRFIAATADGEVGDRDIRAVAATVALLRYDLSLVIAKP